MEEMMLTGSCDCCEGNSGLTEAILLKLVSASDTSEDVVRKVTLARAFASEMAKQDEAAEEAQFEADNKAFELETKKIQVKELEQRIAMTNALISELQVELVTNKALTDHAKDIIRLLIGKNQEGVAAQTAVLEVVKARIAELAPAPVQPVQPVQPVVSA